MKRIKKGAFQCMFDTKFTKRSPQLFTFMANNSPKKGRDGVELCTENFKLNKVTLGK